MPRRIVFITDDDVPPRHDRQVDLHDLARLIESRA